MGEALRDAYVLACVELDAASAALVAAEARLRAARAECERLEKALQMTGLSQGDFPEAAAPAPGGGRPCRGCAAGAPEGTAIPAA